MFGGAEILMDMILYWFFSTYSNRILKDVAKYSMHVHAILSSFIALAFHSRVGGWNWGSKRLRMRSAWVAKVIRVFPKVLQAVNEIRDDFPHQTDMKTSLSPLHSHKNSMCCSRLTKTDSQNEQLMLHTIFF
jgi:hypothetical protein